MNHCKVAEAIGLILLLAFIVTVPLPYGAVTPFGVMKLELMAFAAAAMAMFSRDSRLGAATLPVYLVAAIAAVGALQLVPIDSDALAGVAPATTAIYADANRVLRMFGAPEARPRLSIAPTDTVRATLLILAYVACFVAAAKLLRSRLQRRLACAALLVSSVIHVVYATTTQSDDNRLHGLFINPNHFAGYLEIALAVAFALLWTEIITGRERLARTDDRGARVELRLIPIAWRALIWIVIAVGIALTRSRMGIAAATITTVLLLVTASLHSRTTRVRYAALAVTILAAAVVIVGITTCEFPLLRFLASDPRDPQTDSRFRLWQLSIDTWREFPHFGSGLGTFREAFKRIQPADFPGLYEQAHSDALQLLVTGGWISLLLAAAGLTALFALLLRGWWRQRHREESAVTLAAAGALFSLAVHGIAEFNFSIPAIPTTLAIILGMGWAAARSDTT